MLVHLLTQQSTLKYKVHGFGNQGRKVSEHGADRRVHQEQNPMKSLIIATAALIGAGLFASAASAADVTVRIEGVQARHGVLYVALQSRDQFMQSAMTSGAVRADPKAGTVTLKLSGVPAGDYALSVLHDEDGDHQMKFDDNNRPMEGWAMAHFSGGHKPTFDEAKITVSASGTVVTARMTYPN
jgi:uncharacterized protein (DUF2141 family)